MSATVIGGETYAAAQIATAKQIYQFFLGRKITYQPYAGRVLLPEHACAFVAMAKAETSFVLDVPGDDNTAHTFWQLHRDRLDLACKVLGYPVGATAFTAEQQIEIGWWDFNSAGQNVARFAVVKNLLATKTAGDAALALTKYWERAGAKGAATKRSALAETFHAYFSPAGGGESS